MTISLPNLTDPNFLDSCYIVDIETKSDFKTWRMGGIRKADGSRVWTYQSKSVFRDALLSLTEWATVVTWNGSRFDIPYFGAFSKQFKFRHIDLMQLYKMLYFNERKFSLDHWAQKLLGVGKIEGIDYDNSPDDELEKYLERDLEITGKLLVSACAAAKGRGEELDKPLQLEDRVAQIVQEQVDRRVNFDLPLAMATHNALQERMDDLEEELEKELPIVPIPSHRLKHPPKKQFKADGSPSHSLKTYLGKYGYAINYDTINQRYTATNGLTDLKLPIVHPIETMMHLHPANQGDIKDHLLRQGWEPTEWNVSAKTKDKTSPRLTLKETGEPCPNLVSMGFTYIPLLSEWLQARNRKNVLLSDNGTGWITEAKKAQYGFSIPSDADTMGANTYRFTHKKIANVPRPTSYCGKEFRQLFRARQGMKLVGWDASALEARVEGHYTHYLDKDYAEELCNGDVHQRNLDLIPELGDRDGAKKFKYAVTYGASYQKIARTFGWSDSQAQIVFDDFWENNPALSSLRNNILRHKQARGDCTIRGIDGRPVHVRSDHSLVNALFQSAGAIIMKYAMLIAHNQIKAEFGDEAHGLIRYHDEEVWECLPEHAERVAEIGAASIVAAGKYLGLNVPLEAEAKIGDTWYDVH